MAKSGTTLSSFTYPDEESEHWIINSSAFDHMIENLSLFLTYAPCSRKQFVKIAYGSFAIMAGVGSIKLSHKLCLYDVLHIPRLTCNWLSISKLTIVIHCVVNFNSNFYVFKTKCQIR